MSPIRLDCFLEIQTEHLYQVPRLINTTTINATPPPPPTTTTTTTSRTTSTTWDHWGVPEGCPSENPRSPSSSKVEKFEFWTFLTCGGGYGTDGQSDLYYPLVADKNSF